MKDRLEKRLAAPDRRISYNKKEDKLRVEDVHSGKGITVSLPGIISRYEEEKEQAIDEVVYYIEEALKAMQTDQNVSDIEKKILPVIRSTSFPTKTDKGVELLYREHTAETRIFYAIDMGQSYRLIHRDFLKEASLTEEAVDEMARFNLRALPTQYKEETVADNVFYFINSNDGYDGSRLLNQSLIDEMKTKAEGDLAVAIPHQDVLIFADLRNKQGYDILAQMTMKFFTTGNIPITSLPFLVEEDKLQPVFIMAKNRPVDEN
ncbi:uncharacterized protein YtpQ (UPF0354 family) [Pullulanibacillus pueri]|uniref:UPF0354 protein YtpQ n=1 Tax=Pullulanibacillus pueri TaxID=1437324 RepID=A0A8J3EP65_9BACL|nr:DUF1444 family protein [Pullulanibacillus pueri]MBM7683977.1 uncharacterized protein YtpQ (UPF0354 family) [Pullulanibacillus pueri]GGH88135.1 UPF0354 protein YtpQ [Pullulanibacillus pueri]